MSEDQTPLSRGLARRAAALFDGHRLLPIGAPFLAVSSTGEHSQGDARAADPLLASRAATVTTLAVKLDGEVIIGDGEISIPVARYAASEADRFNVVEGPLVIGFGGVAGVSEVFFGEQAISEWVHKHHDGPPLVPWLASEQVAAARLYRLASMLGHFFTFPEIIATRERVGKLIAQKIQGLSNLVALKPSRSEDAASARTIINDLHYLGYNDQLISKWLMTVRETKLRNSCVQQIPRDAL